MRITLPLLLLTLGLLSPVVLRASDEQSINLIVACRLDDLDGVKASLASGADINAKGGDKMTPLMHALDTGHDEIARYLVEQGAELNYMSSNDETPLSMGVRSNDAATVAYLLQKGAKWDQNQEKVAYLALVWNQADTLRVLDKNGMNLTRQQDRITGRNALNIAAIFNNLSAVDYLIDQGMDVNQPGRDGNYPLALAAFEGHLDMVKHLLKAGADPNAISLGAMNVNDNPREKHTALVAAVRDNNLAVVKELLAAGADPNLLNGLALRYADVSGNGAVYERLLESGAKQLPAYSFTEIETIQPNWVEDPQAIIREDPVDWAGLSVINNPTLRQTEVVTSYTGPSVKLAVIPTRKDLETAELLVTAELSDVLGIELLERAQLQKSIDEWSLAQSGATAVGQTIRTGKLLGADGLIILSEAGQTLEAKIVSTATGLVLRILPGDKEHPDQWAEQIKSAVLQNASLLHGADDFTLVSIPLITSIRNDVQEFDEGRALSHALGIYLGAIDGVYLIDRHNMLQLAGEKMLTEDLREFYSSGWLVDGSFDTTGDKLDITLRLRQTQNGQETVISASGSIQDPAAVMTSLSQDAAELFGEPHAGASNHALEADIYLGEAQRAIKLQQWEAAQHAADAAWVLGNGSDETIDIRLITRLQRLRTLHLLFEQKIALLEGPAQVMGYRAPFLVERIDAREMTATQCIELTGELLAIYQPLTQKRQSYSPAELDQLMFYPEVLKGMITPLESLHSVSDEKSHSQALTHLRKQILATTLAVLAIADENDYPHLYQSVFNAYLQALPYLIRDEDALYTELNQRLAEASAMREPLSKHTAYTALDKIMRGHMNKVGGQAGTSWQRIARRMAKSDNPDEKLLGYEMVRFDAHDYQLRERLSESMLPIVLELSRTDDSLLGNTIYYDTQIDEDLNVRGDFRKYPEYAMGIWYPDPFDMYYGRTHQRHGVYRQRWNPPTQGGRGPYSLLPDYREQWANIFLTRLRSTAQSGSAAFPYNDIHDKTKDNNLAILVEMNTLAVQAKAKLDQRVTEQTQWENTAYRYNSYVVKPIHSAMAEAQQREASTGPAVFQLNPFISPLIHPDNPDRDDKNFHFSGIIETDNGTWVYDSYAGIFHYNLDSHVIDQTIFLPIDAWVVSEFFDDRYFAVWFNGKDHKPFFDIGVYDRKTGSWKYYNPDRMPAFSQRVPSYVGINSIIIIGDNLYYSYRMHPDTSGMRLPEVQKDARTTAGVARINLQTGEETLLVSSSRTPTETPVDNVKSYALKSLQGGELLVNKHVYNPQTGQWRAKKRSEVALPTEAQMGRWITDRFGVKSINYDQSTKTLSMDADNYYRAYPFEATRLHLQLDLISYDNLNIPTSFKQMQSSHDRDEGHPRFNVMNHKKGLILQNGQGFYYISGEDLKPYIEKTITYLETKP